MHRIDVPSATVDGLFTEGSPTGGVPATVVSDDWLNDLQENVIKVIEEAGITLVKGDYTQLLAAIVALSGDGSDQVLAATGRKDFAGGFRLQWAKVAHAGATNLIGASVTFLTSFGALPFYIGAISDAGLTTCDLNTITLGGVDVTIAARDSGGSVVAGNLYIFALGVRP